MQPADFVPDAPGDLVLLPQTVTPAQLRDLEAGIRMVPVHAYAFVPHPLPPRLTYDDGIVAALGRAMLALGRLDQVVRDLANPYVLVRPFLRREAVTSSRIEGMRAGIADLALFEATGIADQDRPDDVREVENYLKALEYALAQPPDLPISIGLVRELHQLLLEGVRGGLLESGQIRTRQNYIGGHGDRIEVARYVPPPPGALVGLLSALEQFIAGESAVPPLVRIALVHSQFEAIHPFLHGNGRVGRLLVALLLQRWELMEHPVVDLSAYVLRHRDAYVDGLLRVSQQGDWRGWVSFFLDAFEFQANDAFRRSRRLLALKQQYQDMLAREIRTGKPDKLVDYLFEHLTADIRGAAQILSVTYPTAQRLVGRLEEYGILEEATGRRRDRVWRARQIIAVLDDKEP
ncbi:MAG: Fic family protein [Chloroflexota bacterium]|nr:Fic family protein [Chloroflexota bacterium]